LHEYRDSGHWDRRQDHYATAPGGRAQRRARLPRPGDEELAEWLTQETGDAQAASHADAVSSGELVINALPGDVALSALTAINPAALSGKILLDLANAVVPSDGGLDLLYPNASLAAAIQKALPETPHWRRHAGQVQPRRLDLRRRLAP
jgi:hypothetical protein